MTATPAASTQHGAGATAAAPPATAAPARWVGLDALRGIAIASMILVNNPGDWGHVYPPLLHAAWHGCTFTDLVFPTFLFVAGASIVPSLGGALARGRSARELAPRVVRRALLLIGIGFLLQSFPWVAFTDGGLSFERVLNARWPGVLHRIGVCYGTAAMLFLFTSDRSQRRVLIGCLLLYWPLLALGPTPDGGAPDLASKGNHLAGWLDRTLLGSHIYGAKSGGLYDPEGVLSTIPAIGTTLLGTLAGRILASARPLGDKVRALLLRGACWTAVGAVWGWFFPINKALWTSSYALFTAGIAASGLGLCVWIFEERPYARLARPLVVYGRNALLVFVGSALLGRSLRLITVGGVSVSDWCYQRVLANWADPYVASLLYALLWVSGWYLVLAWLYRRGVVWKL